MQNQPSPSPPEENPTPSRILIVRLSAHGDVIHTLPLVSAIKKDNPEAFVGWLIEASAAPLLMDHPMIDRLHVLETKRWLKEARNPLRWGALRDEIKDVIAQLKVSGYQVSLDPQGLLKSAIWPWLAKIPRRMGFGEARERADFCYTEKLAPIDIRSGKTPAVMQYLELVRALGITVGKPDFTLPWIKTATQTRINLMLSPFGLLWGHQQLVVVAPFTRWESKHWRPEAWVSLMAKLLAENFNIVILGSPADWEASEEMRLQLNELDRARVLNLAGQTGWPDLYELFQRAALVIGLDSAPLHVANAVGKPALIGLFGSTHPGRTGPLGDRQVVLSSQLSCQPCYERICPLGTDECMKKLSPEQVMEAVRQMVPRPGAV